MPPVMVTSLGPTALVIRMPPLATVRPAVASSAIWAGSLKRSELMERAVAPMVAKEPLSTLAPAT